MGSSASVGNSEAHTRAKSSRLKIVVPQSIENEKKSQPDGTKMSADGEKKFTEEDVKTMKQDKSKVLNEAIDILKRIPDLRTKNGLWNNDLLKSLEVFYDTYWSFEEIHSLSYNVIQKYRREAGRRLSESKSTSVICKVIMDGWQRGYTNREGKTDRNQYMGIYLSLLNLVNFSDCTPEVTYDIAREENFLETAKGILTKLFPVHLRKKGMTEDEEVMSLCLSMYNNVSKVDQNIPRLRSLQTVPIFNFFLDARKRTCRLSALSALANIIDEKESAILQNKADAVSILLKTLGLAINDPFHCNKGWSAEECAMTVRRLARNDANKKLLVQMGCLPHLVNLAKCGNVKEQREAVGAICFLAFEKQNHIKILEKKNLNIINFLIELKNTSLDKEVRNAVDGTLWIFRKKIQEKKYKHIVSSFEEKNKLESAAKHVRESLGAAVGDRKGHIMISYDWSQQKEVLKIRDVLKKHGYAVWMDIEKMSGSLLGAMAEAIECAHVVLVCMSQKYQYSSNCRAEAEYAFQLDKKIVPLKMERGYKPDGWLGILVGTKLFFEFSGKYSFKAKIKHLIHEINMLYGNENVEPKDIRIENPNEESMDTVNTVPVAVIPKNVDGVPVVVTSRKAVHSAHLALLANIRKWTPDDVNKWIKHCNLPKEYFGELRGGELAILLTMRLEAPDFFYNYLKKDLGISSLQTMDMFVKGLEDLQTWHQKQTFQ